MQKRRRYHITEDEAESIILAIMAAVPAIQARPDYDLFYQFQCSKMEKLKNKLQNYKWEVEA